MTSAVSAVLIASASSVAKVFLISAVGFFAVKYPRGKPLMPPDSLGMLSRFTFTVLNLPLIYSAIGSTLSIDVLGSLWFVPLSGVVVIALSFVVATITERLPSFRVEHRIDFEALRIACSFPNVVAIPVLVFPSLCEYEVVHSSFVGNDVSGDSMGRDPIQECSMSLNAMTFAYFFAWIFMFFLLGNRMLVDAGRRRKQQEDGDEDATDEGISEEQASGDSINIVREEDRSEAQLHALDGAAQTTKSAVGTVLTALRHSILNPCSIAMWLGLATAMIRPLQEALFAPGGALRFVGSAIESLAVALPSLATMITAASLVLPKSPEEVGRALDETAAIADDVPGDEECESSGDSSVQNETSTPSSAISCLKPAKPSGGVIYDPNYVETEDPPEQSQSRSRLRQMRRSSMRFASEVLQHSQMIVPAMRSPTFRMHAWFNLTRLIITPGIVCGILIGIDCGTSIFDNGIPHMAKLVVLLNSCLPGALLVIISLKSEGLSESAAVVAKVYFPSYVVSIFTIAGWAAVGLVLSIPNEDGVYFCDR